VSADEASESTSSTPTRTDPGAVPARVVVGRIGRAHGIRGEIAVDIRTDRPADRLAPGTTLATDPPERGPLTIEASRAHTGGLLLRFAGVADRNQAEALRGTLLLVDTAALPPIAEADEFYDHQLIGLAAVQPDGAAIGTLTDVLHGAGADLLVIRLDAEPRDVLVPFVAAIVGRVDVAAGRIVVDPPPGLLDL
jgi:16S rRNA processing protein RimM